MWRKPTTLPSIHPLWYPPSQPAYPLEGREPLAKLHVTATVIYLCLAGCFVHLCQTPSHFCRGCPSDLEPFLAPSFPSLGAGIWQAKVQLFFPPGGRLPHHK